MVTENVNIRFRESGARVIKRKIDDIGNAANNATRGIFLLQRALFVIGGAGIVRGLVNYADALTNIENRLRLTSQSTENMEAVQDELLAAANRSRSGFRELADVYSRVALSTRQLGTSQQEAIELTESLAKASIISGASAREANAALVQLGQGLASNTLRGDELRSVLEQLPFVADVIAKELVRTGQVTGVAFNDAGDAIDELGNKVNIRGKLRELATDGKISAEVILDAFKNAKEEIDELFETTVPTIGQAFLVAENNFLAFIDKIDDATGASGALATAIIKISQNLEFLLFTASAAASALIGIFAGKVIGSVNSYIDSLTRAGAAVTRYRAIETASAAASSASAAAKAQNTRAQLANITARQAVAAKTLQSAQAEYAEATALFANGRARDTQTGRFIANQAARDRLSAATVRLTAAERANQIATSRMTSLRTASTAADNAAAAARGRLSAATAAQTGFVARLAATFPTLTGVVRVATAGLTVFFGILAANPIGAVIAALTALTLGITFFGDRIKVTEDKVVSLKDAAIAAFQLITEAITPVTVAIQVGFQQALRGVQATFGFAFDTVLTIVKNAIDAVVSNLFIVPRVALATVQGIIAAYNALPGGAGSAIDAVVAIFVKGFEAVANIGINAVNKIIGAFNRLAGTKVGEILGIDAIEELGNADFSGIQTNFGDGGQGAAEAFTGAFQSSLESTDPSKFLNNFGDAVIERARENIATAAEKEGSITSDPRDERIPGAGETDGGSGKKGKKGAGGSGTTFAEEIAELEKLIMLEKQYGLEKEQTTQVLRIEEALKRSLTETERALVNTAVERLEVSKIQGQILQETLGPQEQMRLTQVALNELFAQGAINLETYNQKLRETQIAADQASNTLAGGFRSSIASAIQSAGEFGEALGGTIVGAAGNAADAIVEFAKTGQLNIRQFFADLFAQLLKLAAQRLLLQFLGGFLGVPGGGLAGFSQGGSILPSFAGGGSLTPNGPGSTDTQVVAFNKRPDERVDILTPGQQAAQQRKMNGAGNNNPQPVNNNLNVAAVLSPQDVVGAFDNSDGETLVINMLRRNTSTVKQIIGG